MNKSESKYFNTAVRFDKALLALLEKKSFEYITISEICEKAEVNRSTFYLHYDNTRDLLQETISYVLDNFASCFPISTRSMIAQFATCSLEDLRFINEQYLLPYLSYIRENRRVFSAVLSQPVAFDTEGIFHKLFDNVFRPILDRFDYPADEQSYVIRFYLNGLTAIISEWIRNDCQKSVGDVSAIIHVCIYGKA